MHGGRELPLPDQETDRGLRAPADLLAALSAAELAVERQLVALSVKGAFAALRTPIQRSEMLEPKLFRDPPAGVVVATCPQRQLLQAKLMPSPADQGLGRLRWSSLGLRGRSGSSSAARLGPAPVG